MTWSWQPRANWAWEFPPCRARLSDKAGAAHDGDTVVMIIDQGFNGHQEESLRLEGVWAPELHQPGGQEAAAFTEMVFGDVIERAKPRGARWPFVVSTVPVMGAESSQRRSFIRYMATVFALDTGECLNEEIAHFLTQHPEWSGGIGARRDDG